MKKSDIAKAHARLVARAWRDESFRKALLRKPHATLKSEGLAVPKGVRVRFHQSSDKEFHIVLPARPATRVKARRPAATANLTCVG
jgi:hypothetical protein